MMQEHPKEILALFLEQIFPILATWFSILFLPTPALYALPTPHRALRLPVLNLLKQLFTYSSYCFLFLIHFLLQFLQVIFPDDFPDVALICRKVHCVTKALVLVIDNDKTEIRTRTKCERILLMSRSSPPPGAHND